MADNGFMQAAARWSGSVLRVEEGRCVNIRGRSEICARCEKACPKDAITLGLDTVGISDDCTDCGACLPVCPAGALRLEGFSPVHLVRQVTPGAPVHLHCRESSGGGAAGGIVIPCHQVLDARLIAAMTGAGCHEIHFHGLAGCADCRHGSARKTVEKIARTLRRWLGEDAPRLLLDPRPDSRPDPRENPGGKAPKPARHDQVRLDRRRFFRLAGSQVAAAATGWVAPMRDEPPQPRASHAGALTPAAPDPYQSTIAPPPAASAPPVSPGAIAWKRASLPFFHRAFSDACTLCMVCAERCPTGALQALAGDGRRGIAFSGLLCTNCGLCTQVCPFDAISAGAVRTPDRIPQAPVLLKQVAQQECPQCRGMFTPETAGQDLCQTCRNEQEIEEEWLSFMEA